MAYSNIVHALHKKELTLEKKDLLLRTTMDVFKNSRNDLDFKLSPFSEIQPLLSDLLYDSDNSEYRRTAWDFVTIFTDCKPTLRYVDPRVTKGLYLAPTHSRHGDSVTKGFNLVRDVT